MSKVCSITYDLMSPGRDYSTLIERIKRLGSWARPTASQWIVVTSMSASGVHDVLRVYMDANDKLLVAALTGEAAWSGLPRDVSEWLKSELGTVSGVRAR